MAISGLVGAGAQDAFAELLKEQMLAQQQAEVARAAQAREALAAEQIRVDREQIAQRGALADREATLRERAEDNESRQFWEETQRTDREAMQKRFDVANKDALLDDAVAALPEGSPARQIVAIRRAGGPDLTGEEVDPTAGLERTRQEAKIRADEQIRAGIAVENAREANRPPPRQPNPNGMSDSQVTTARMFQDDYARDSKPYLAVRSAYQQVRGASEKPDAAGDLSLIFGYMKMLDPTSVVRETEFANAQNAAGVPDRVRNMWNRLLSGERLNPNQRREFVGQAHRIYEDARSNQARVRKTYGDRAVKFQIDPGMVLDEDDAAIAAPGAAPGGGETPYQRYLRQKGGQ